MLPVVASRSSPRYYALDNLRAGMISIVMFGHALLPYVTVPRRFKDIDTHLAFDVIAIFLYSFAMPAFFVTAGFAAAALYGHRGLRGLAQNRFRTIFLPLLAAYALLSPLTRGAYSFAAEVSATGSLAAGMDRLLLGDWIRWGKTYHLWFLVSLLFYTALAVGLRWGFLHYFGTHAARVLRAARTGIASRWRSTLLTLIAATSTVPAYVLADGGATALTMQLAGFTFFVFGWLLYLHRDLLPSFHHGAWREIAVALVVLPVAAWSTRERLFAADDADLLIGATAGLSNSIIAACMTVGLLGIFQGRFERPPSALGQYVSDASYWIYLIHLPLLIFVAGALSAAPLPALTKYLLTITVVVPMVFASYHLCVRATRFGRFLKGRQAPERQRQ